MSWELQSDRPIYAQLIERIEILIFTGIYPPGSRLPSVRELAQEAAVNPNTMQKALSQLEESGLLVTHRTSGRSVTEEVQLVNTAKDNLAKNQVVHFMESMKKLGYDKQSITELLEQMQEE